MRVTFQTRLVLQALLDRAGVETYGFELAQITGLKPGTLYPILGRLLAERWVSERWEEIDEREEGRRRRRYYSLTAMGEHHARRAVEGDTRALRHFMPGFAR
jgi:PadR family transcriptional regulator PadR